MILLLERLELYVSSGLTINKALAISAQGISVSSRKSWQKNSIEQVIVRVESGGLLAQGLVQFMHISKTTAGLIEHGESSGGLVRALSSARILLEKDDELLRKCTSAMAYPFIIGLFACVLTIGLIRGVMPQIIPMLKSLHVELPLLTRIVMYISEVLTSHGLYIGFGIIFLCAGLRICYTKIPAVKKFCHSVCIRIPLIGGLVQDYALTVFLQSCGSLVEAGLPVSHAYTHTLDTVPLIPLRDALKQHEHDLSRGVSLGIVLSQKRIPAYVSSLVHAGESSGTLGSSILRAASILDRDIDHMLKKVTSLIEPMMMAGMGCVVGAIALSIMMPIYDISKVLQK